MLKKDSKILIIAPKAYHLFDKQSSNTAFGGAEIQLFLLGKELHRLGYKTNFLVGDFGQKEKEFNGIKIYKSFKMTDSPFKKLFVFRKKLLSLDYDVYIQRALSYISPLLSVIFKRRKKKFIYMVAHDSEVDGSHPITKSIFGKLLANVLWKNAFLVIAQNKYQYDKLKNICNNLIIVKNLHEIPKGSSDRKVDKGYLLWVGRSVGWKRPELFLKLSKELPNEKFVFVLNKANEGDKDYEKLKQDALQNKNIIFLESIPYCNISKLYKDAKIFVSTSKKEGFPNTFIDAGVWGVPIASLSVDPDDFIQGGKCGIYGNNDWEVFINEIKKILKDEKLYKEYSGNIYKYMKSNHDLNKNVLNIINYL
ncbi:MAG: glycosyltransferase family 4 protein [Candidatus Dojkabacteria bacterium]|nr:glycosyltransferase family 4 protein [Candidatus Dojkabacteria bacterium]